MADIHYISPRLRHEAERLGIIGSKADTFGLSSKSETRRSDYAQSGLWQGHREWEDRMDPPAEGWWKAALNAIGAVIAFYVLWLVLSHASDLHVVMGVAR